MQIAVTGATGFLGRYIVRHLAALGHELRCWYRPSSDRGGLSEVSASIRWVPGDLCDKTASAPLVSGCDAVVHAALFRPGAGFIGSEGDLFKFVERNILGTLRLIEESQRAGVSRFVLISTCAVHDVILPDRLLDEAHPLWPKSHYGAHKAALEAFVSSFGRGQGFPICALRPTGIYGLAYPAARSKWFDLVGAVGSNQDVQCTRGGKEVHAADVARSVELLLNAGQDKVAGEAFNCCDRYISEHEVATIAQSLSGGKGRIQGEAPSPKHQIITEKLQSLGMKFGGEGLLTETIGELLAAHCRESGDAGRPETRD